MCRDFVCVFLCYGPWCPFCFCNHIFGEERTGYFVLAVLLLLFGCVCVLRRFLAVPWDGLWSVNAAFPGPEIITLFFHSQLS